jgi:N-acetyltransferase 10
MVKKKVDSRIRVLIENGLALHHRSLFFLIGDHARNQVVNLHYILSKASVSTKPSVLWAYKKELGFTSHRQKRMRKLKKDIARGLRTAEDELRPFDLFVNSTDIRYCYCKKSERILGNTY